MRYQAVIFDFNGVILWDRKWHEMAWNEISSGVRGRRLTGQEMENHIHGKTPKETFAYLLQGKSHAQLKKLSVKKEKLYHDFALRSKKFNLSPGAEKLFDLLKENKIRQNIATSSPWINVRFYYKYLPLQQWFPLKDIVYGNGKLPSKPAPDIYWQAARKIKTNVRECVVVEDSRSGLESARRAGAGKIIAVAHQNNYQTLKSSAFVHKVIKNLGQITLEDLKS